MIDKTTLIRRRNAKKPRKPILIVGLPGIGSVGRLVAEHIKRQYKAEKIATIYSPHFPHQVLMLKNGKLRLVSNRLYLIRSYETIGNDIMILTGDSQPITPEGQYSVNSMIVDTFKREYNGTFIYTIGGYSMANNEVKKPRVFGNASTNRVITSFKNSDVLFGKSRGAIMGSAGLIVAFARMQHVDAICLMGETSFIDIDAAAAKAVLGVLAKKLNLSIKTTQLDQLIVKTAKAVKELENQMAPEMGQQQGTEPAEPHGPSYIR